MVAPAFIAIKLGRGLPLVVAWIIGIALNLAAIAVSYNRDLPAGYTLVFFHAFLAIAFSLGRRMIPVRDTVTGGA